MRISHQFKYLYLAVPRTGSTSVRDALDPVSDVRSVHKPLVDNSNPFYNHIPYREIELIFQKNEWDISSYLKFCVVRNPYDRVVSLYHHYREKGNRWADGKSVSYNILRKARYGLLPHKSFESFVNSINRESVMHMSTSSFSSDANRNVMVDHILKYENISEDYQRIAQILNLPKEQCMLPRLNSSKNRGEYRKYYTKPSLVDKISNIYRDDIERFGYDFE